jgi:hypothetical protein
MHVRRLINPVEVGMTSDEVLRLLPPPPKDLLSMLSRDKAIDAIRKFWIEHCSGKVATAELTQDEISGLFLVWLKRGKYTEAVTNFMVRKFIRVPSPKKTIEQNQERRRSAVFNAAAKLYGLNAVLTGQKIVEFGQEVGDTEETLAMTWKKAGKKPRSVISDAMEDVSRQLLLAHREERADDDDHALDAAE